MRLSINLDEENYRLARSLAREEGISISKAVNLLFKRLLAREQKVSTGTGSKTRSGFTAIAGKQVVTSQDVAEFLAENP